MDNCKTLSTIHYKNKFLCLSRVEAISEFGSASFLLPLSIFVKFL